MGALSNHLLSLILFTPLAGALLIALVSSRCIRAIRGIAHASAATVLVLALPLWFEYEPHGKTWQFAERGAWIPSIGASYYVGADGFSILLILLTSLIGWVGIIASRHDIQNRVKPFYALILILQTGLLGVFMSLDFLQVFLFWETALVAMVFLIRGWGEGSTVRSAMKFAFFTQMASLAILVGILVLYFSNHAASGVHSLDVTEFHTLRLPISVQKWVFLAFFLGFGATSSLFPLHAWLPDAQSDAPTAASIILPAVVLKMGAYGFVRFSLPILPDASRDFGPAVGLFAVVALLCGAILVRAQRDWIRFVAYASVCHMAFVTLGMFALTPASVTGSMLHLFNHGISAAGLLLVVRTIWRGREVEPRTDAGFWRTGPALATVFLIMVMSVAGVPALNGFVGDVMILRGVYTADKLAATVAAAAMVFVSAFTVWLFRRTTSGRGAVATVGHLSARDVGIFVPFVALAFWIGLYPAPFVARLETSMGRIVARVNPAYAPYVAQGSDCATPAPPEPSGPPPGFMLTESCADGSEMHAKPSPPDGSRR
jgi:NADH-quinone oxidoreductase subunit M